VARPLRDPRHRSQPSADAATVGWREWVALPALGIPRIQCKVDTGARTSALHAVDIEPGAENGMPTVHFRLYPLHGDRSSAIACSAAIAGRRQVRSSNGMRELRYVIVTPMILGSRQQWIEITLADRDPMRFGMLLGRQSLVQGGWRVDPGRAFVNGRPDAVAAGPP
jgi:hypothetical protein